MSRCEDEDDSEFGSSNERYGARDEEHHSLVDVCAVDEESGAGVTGSTPAPGVAATNGKDGGILQGIRMGMLDQNCGRIRSCAWPSLRQTVRVITVVALVLQALALCVIAAVMVVDSLAIEEGVSEIGPEALRDLKLLGDILAHIKW